MTVERKEIRGVSHLPPLPHQKNIQTLENFGKIYCKWILLTIFLYFKLSFAAFESLKLLIFPCRAIFFIKIS